MDHNRIIKSEVMGKTAGGKTIALYFDKACSLYFLNFVEGGELPVEFQGKFTTPELARIAITKYNQRVGNEQNVVVKQESYIPEVKMEGEVVTKKKWGPGSKLKGAVSASEDTGMVNLGEPDAEPEFEEVAANYVA